VQSVDQGTSAIEDSVAMRATVTGRELHDGFGAGMHALTFGLIRMRDERLFLGPLELLRFGDAELSPFAVEWPIEGGLLTRRPGGRFRIAAGGGRLVASVRGYRPALPLPLYAVTQLPVHHLVTRLHLLRVRGREPAPGVAAPGRDRLQAAAIDIALCAAVAALAGRRRRLRVLLGVAAVYHVTCWAAGGRTLGGSVMRQRVVAVDGSAVGAGQAVVRLIALPVAWARRRPVHDEVACTEVVVD
jgi:hypothetical protein